MDPYCYHSLYPPNTAFPDPDSFVVPEENTVKLHAPIPLQGQSPLLYSEFDPYPQIELEDCNQHNFSSSTCGLEGVPLNPMYCPEGQTTFPTPSELMADLASRGNSSSSLDEFAVDTHSEPARKARRRAMAQSVGFVPTDPDTISSHEKKRYYLECIEQYVLYLHEQLKLLGEIPPPMERVAPSGGLSCTSIRTLLVHMEHNTRRLNMRTMAEEQRFLDLRNEIYVEQGLESLVESVL